MDAPAFSTFSAIAEFFVTAGVFYIVLHNYARKGFAWRLATVLIVFEFSVNMMYMIFRMRETTAGQESAVPHPLAPFMAAHGVLSLLVFLLLVVYSYLAYAAAKRARFFFRDHPAVTWSFLALWMLSVGSGWALYFINYF